MSVVLVLGGDGFCGWPTSLLLADEGYEVIIVDNLSRRRIDKELEVQSLTPIASIEERLKAWEEVAGHKKRIRHIGLDISKDYEGLRDLIRVTDPKTIVHFAEQRAAPYSMKNDETANYTVDNNVNATQHVLRAIVATGNKTTLVHLGTMGVYGYGAGGSTPIPEGYLNVKIDTPEGEISREILHPASPGSIYHMTKVLDQEMFQAYARLFDLRITDLHQGIVWGTQTKQTVLDERLINRFDYDGDYGTVLNRFLSQAAIGHPLTVHGEGGQTRAFIHIQNTVECVKLAVENPPQYGEKPRIHNQVTETHRVRDLAALVARITDSKVVHLMNPRREASENELIVTHNHLVAMGLKPILLKENLLHEVKAIAEKYKHRMDTSKILATSLWSPNAPVTKEAAAPIKELDVSAVAAS